MFIFLRGNEKLSVIVHRV